MSRRRHTPAQTWSLVSQWCMITVDLECLRTLNLQVIDVVHAHIDTRDFRRGRENIFEVENGKRQGWGGGGRKKCSYDLSSSFCASHSCPSELQYRRARMISTCIPLDLRRHTSSRALKVHGRRATRFGLTLIVQVSMKMDD